MVLPIGGRVCRRLLLRPVTHVTGLFFAILWKGFLWLVVGNQLRLSAVTERKQIAMNPFKEFSFCELYRCWHTLYFNRQFRLLLIAL